MANTKEKENKTMWECVSSIISDYGINTVNISNRVGDHLVADILQTLISNGGYLSIENKEEEKNG